MKANRSSWWTVLFVALLVLTSNLLVSAQENTIPADQAANQVIVEAAGAEGTPHTLPLNAPVITQIGPFKISNSMVVTWVVALGLIVFAQLATRNIQLIPVGLQNFAEWVVESLENFLAGIMGEDLVRKTFWFFATVFLFILSANWFGLLPGVGTVGWGVPDAKGHLHITQPLLRGANADLNMTLALALTFFVLWLFWSIREIGVGGFLSHIFLFKGEAAGAMKLLLFLIFFIVGFLEVISIMIRPISLTFRLFGNIYAGESLLEMMHHKGGFLAALPFYGLELMVGAIQALVFTLLTAVFTALMCKHDDEHHEGHAAEGAAHH
jgi:F-type H+-transporting ATPase subunit a